MKKILIASLVATLALSACQKQETPKPDTPTEQSTQTAPADQHDHEHKEGEHDHDHHDHEGEGHAHHHDDGKAYQCDNNKAINIAIHDHEGETEAHATIDDIEYDLHPADDTPNTFISKEEGINGKGMKMVQEPDGKTTFKSLDDKEVLLTCTPA